VELAPAFQHVVGGSHNSFIVEMREYLVVFGCAGRATPRDWILGAARAKYPGKPVKYLRPHAPSYGSRRRSQGIAAQGATIVTGKGTAAHFRCGAGGALTGRNSDLPARDLTATTIIEVTDKQVSADSTVRSGPT